MTERLLQFIWQFQYFNNTELQTVSGDPLQVIHQGYLNTHQGPDFLEARIRIDNALWIGNIELHLLASDWKRHAHHQDQNYDNVILHVVWIDDDEHALHGIPTLLLQDRIYKLLLQQYEIWMKSQSFIPCGQYISLVGNITRLAWKERVLVERIQRKSGLIKDYLVQNNHHWEEAFWWMLAKNFGLYVNAEPFEEIAKTIPLALLSKHKNHVIQLEALLLGQAGLLADDISCKYFTILQKEYRFYQKKYSLKPVSQPVHFLRMRPKAFPTIRLAQLAMLIHTSDHLFTALLDAGSLREVKEQLNVTANDFWHYHYTFSDESAYQPKKLGAHMVNNIIINTVVPMVFAYGHFHQQEAYKQKALDWIQQVPAEKNSITVQFAKLGIENNNAFDSQSLIELKTQYCDKRRCLDCAIGNAILKRSV